MTDGALDKMFKDLRAELHEPPEDPAKRRKRAAHMLRSLIKEAVRQGRKDSPGLTESTLKKALRERHRRQKAAQRDGIKPGSKRWNALWRIKKGEDRAARKKRR